MGKIDFDTFRTRVSQEKPAEQAALFFINGVLDRLRAAAVGLHPAEAQAEVVSDLEDYKEAFAEAIVANTVRASTAAEKRAAVVALTPHRHKGKGKGKGRVKKAVAGAVLLLLAWLVPATAHAQVTLNSTSISTAVTRSQQTIPVASVSTLAAGQWIFVERETMEIATVQVSSVTVRRGVRGAAAAHGVGAIVWSGVASRFYISSPANGSVCTATSEEFLPHINVALGELFQCTGNFWTKWGQDNGTVIVSCRALLIADMVDQSCFIADRTYAVVKITEVHAVAEGGGTLTLIPRKNTGTQAPASGVALATALSELATAQTVRTATLTTTAADLLLAAGDRLSLDFTDDAAGELADVVVMFTLIPR